MANTFSKSDFQFTSAHLLGIKYNDGAGYVSAMEEQ